MFFLVKINKYVIVPPNCLGPDLYSYVNQKLNDMLGSCSIKYGYLITIFKIESIENGIVNQNGEAIFTVSFKALVFRPLKGEILDGTVEGVERVGMELSCGSIKMFIPHTKIPSHLVYNQEQEAFVSSENPTCVIKKDKIIRFRVMNVSIKGQEQVGVMVF